MVFVLPLFVSRLWRLVMVGLSWLWSDRRKSLLLFFVHAALLPHVRYWLSSFVSLASSIFVSLHHLLWLPDVPPIPLRGWDWSTSRVQALDTYCNWLSRCCDAFSGSTHTLLFLFPRAASLTDSYKLNLMLFFILLSVFIHVFILQLPNVLFRLHPACEFGFPDLDFKFFALNNEAPSYS